jgi:serine protease Do
MPRRLEFLVYACLIGFGLILSGILQESRSPAIPEFQLPTAPPRAGKVQPGFQTVIPETPERGRHRAVSIGTAFAVNGAGEWATARHVSQDCAALAVVAPNERLGYPVTMVVNHPRTDLSLLVTGGGTFESLALARRDPARRETGFFVGYPQGDPASVEASYLGSDDVDVTDDMQPGSRAERIEGDFWVEMRRAPDFSGSLGGMSGGPVLDSSGDVIGVTVAEEPRRGRVISIAPRSLTELLRGAGSEGWRSEDDAQRKAQVVSDANFAGYGDALRAKISVAQVVCYGFREGLQPRRPRF